MFLVKCGKCGHIFREDALGRLLQSKFWFRRKMASQNLTDAENYHRYHEGHCAKCVCHGCRAIQGLTDDDVNVFTEWK
jgi:hypothetical protein